MAQINYLTQTTSDAIDAAWFRGASLSSIVSVQQYVWRFTFSSGASVVVECLWRLLGPSILLTSEDHGQQFGLPAPVDALARASELLVADSVRDFTLREQSLDLCLVFSSGRSLEILPTSGGYEAWQIVSPRRQHFVAVGGGRLSTYTDEA